MGCWTVIKSFHVKIILLDKQELIQEVQVRLRADILARVRYPSQGQISWPGADILARGRYPGQWQISWTGADILAWGEISWPGGILARGRYPGIFPYRGYITYVSSTLVVPHGNKQSRCTVSEGPVCHGILKTWDGLRLSLCIVEL